MFYLPFHFSNFHMRLLYLSKHEFVSYFSRGCFLFVCCSINPSNEAAKKGLERLEKQMKGVDPDALEEEEENEGEDADADAEEGEFL